MDSRQCEQSAGDSSSPRRPEFFSRRRPLPEHTNRPPPLHSEPHVHASNNQCAGPPTQGKKRTLAASAPLPRLKRSTRSTPCSIKSGPLCIFSITEIILCYTKNIYKICNCKPHPESEFPNESIGVIFIQIDQHLKTLFKKYKGVPILWHRV